MSGFSFVVFLLQYADEATAASFLINKVLRADRFYPKTALLAEFKRCDAFGVIKTTEQLCMTQQRGSERVAM